MIGASQSMLKSGYESAHGLGKGANTTSTSSLEAQNLASAASLGLIYKGSSLVPLVPSGASLVKTMIDSAYNLGKGADIDKTAPLYAQAISSLVPDVPPLGLSVLTQMIKGAYGMGKGADVNKTSGVMAQSIVAYMQAGTVV